MNLDELRDEIALKTKKGLSFIMASVVIWTGVFIVSSLSEINPLTRNLITFCITAPLLPLAYFISRLIGAEFSVKKMG